MLQVNVAAILRVTYVLITDPSSVSSFAHLQYKHTPYVHRDIFDEMASWYSLTSPMVDRSNCLYRCSI